MRYHWENQFKENEVTDEKVFFNRRQFLAGGAGLGAALTVGTHLRAAPSELVANSYEDITTYNNYYEFGTRKSDPAKHAHTLKTTPWAIRIEGEVERPGTYALEDIMAKVQIEERLYRLRCVEAWSMVIPWNGFMLKDLLNIAGVKSSAKYVALRTANRPDEMPGLRNRVLDWPYQEGLRMDEAMHPLTLMATGVYGKDLLGQNGAPVRLVVPWKYGFKSAKSIDNIVVTNRQPMTAWNNAAPQEYGFYANVNPQVDHPRWSQASERVIGQGLFAKRRPTDMFNGYGPEVAALYDGMDMTRNY